MLRCGTALLSVTFAALPPATASSLQGRVILPFPSGSASTVETAVMELTTSDAWSMQDPTWKRSVHVDIAAFRFGPNHVVRLTPYLPTGAQPVEVEGADRIVTLRSGVVTDIQVTGPLEPSGSFEIDLSTAVRNASATVAGSLVGPGQATRASGLARRVYLQQQGRSRAAYRIRVPTMRLHDAREVWVDAETGAILKTRPVAYFATVSNAKVFDPAPTAFPPSAAEMVEVSLSELVDPPPADNRLLGYFLETHNCCKFYTCASGGDACHIDDPQDPAYASSLTDRVCATSTTPGAFESRITVGLPADYVPLEVSGDYFYVDSVFCSELPKVQSSGSGWIADPVDGTDTAAETDTLSEIQAYYHTQTFFEHMRTVANDPSFCLRSTSMGCTDGAPNVDVDGNPIHPFHITTNLLLPDIDPFAVGLQVFQGKGSTPEDPVVIDAYGRTKNAAFIPALENEGADVPPELQALGALFQRPYDSNVYLQGDRDLTYDADIIYHEFTHGVVLTYVPELGSLWRDAWGSQAEPGALNEGWADYFSTSFTDDPALAEYGWPQLRNVDNTDTCPSSLIGEVHQDSLPWSGALWDIREAVGAANVAALDQVLLMSLAQAQSNESMEAQAQRVIANLEADATLSAFVAVAEAAFSDHGITGCERVWPLATLDGSGSVTTTPLPHLEQPSPASVGLNQLAPSVLQLRVEVPQGSDGFALSWEQALGGMLGGVGLPSGESSPALSVLTHEGEPIVWKYEVSGTEAIPYDTADAAIVFDPDDSRSTVTETSQTTGATKNTFGVMLEPDCTGPRTFYVSLVSTAGAISVQNLDVEVNPSASTCDDGGDGNGNEGGGSGGGDPDGGCDAGAGSPLFLIVLGAIMYFRRRRD